MERLSALIPAAQDGGQAEDNCSASNDAPAGQARSSGRTGQRRDVQVSRTLSKLLRHQAANAGIALDAQGFAPLEKVLAWGPLRALDVSLRQVQSIVASDEKQRYCLKPNPDTQATGSSVATDSPAAYLIRANQGHTIKLESSSLLEPVTLAASNVPPRVLHGTYFAFWPAIVAAGGLKPMGRTHVHCSTGTPDQAVVSGMRKDAEIVVEIDIEASLRHGILWWRSDNGVLLTEGSTDGLLASRFFKKVTGRNADIGVLWEDGQKMADLPEGLVARIPPGKGRRSRNTDGGRKERRAHGRVQ